MKKIKQLIYAAALLCSMAGCTKQDPLPDATQQGLNTFGCNIDGVAWIPTGKLGPGGIKPISGSLRDDRVLTILASSPQESVHITVQLNTMRSIGSYKLGNPDTINSYGFYSINNTYLLTDNDNIGQITFSRLDTLKRIFSGTFYFKAKDRNSSKVIDISDGRFDVSY
jgi:hypothetical protein